MSTLPQFRHTTPPNNVNINTFLVSSPYLPHPFPRVHHIPVSTMQHDSRIQRNVLDAEHNMHGIAESSLDRTPGCRLPQGCSVARVTWAPLAECKAFAVDSCTFVPVALWVLLCAVLDCWAVSYARGTARGTVLWTWAVGRGEGGGVGGRGCVGVTGRGLVVFSEAE
jgi:hypothetical protein